MYNKSQARGALAMLLPGVRKEDPILRSWPLGCWKVMPALDPPAVRR